MKRHGASSPTGRVATLAIWMVATASALALAPPAWADGEAVTPADGQSVAPQPAIFLPEDWVSRSLDTSNRIACSPSSTANMTYHNGDVMQTVQVFTIFW